MAPRAKAEPVSERARREAAAKAAARDGGVVRDLRPGRGLKPVDLDIRRLQGDHKFIAFPKLAFARLVKETQKAFTHEPLRWAADALDLLQAASEEYLTYLMADSYLCTHHRKCVTLTVQDMRLVRRVREPHCWPEPHAC
mmetsp:Transcript_20743/g.37733  ORF Transcript_20743/g.37733 Transcript_20743/m.37733 type:complete len:140 (-) Transcript_20743:197-616(-)